MRLSWIDAARGLAITLVVLFHASAFLQAAGLVGGTWFLIDAGLQGLRLPVFFFVSGLLAVGAMARGWRWLLRARVLPWLWLYLLWGMIYVVALSFIGDPRDPQVGVDRIGASLLELLTDPRNGIWYLLALPLYFVVARALVRVPDAVVLVATAALSVVAGVSELTGNWVYDRILFLFFFFLAGLRLRPWIERVVDRSRAWWVLVLAPAYLGLAAAAAALGIIDAPGIRLAVSVVGLALAVFSCAAIADAAPGRLLAAIGTRTLSVYVLNEPIIAIATVLLAPLGPHPALEMAPLVLAATTIAVGWYAWPLLGRIPGLLRAPSWISGVGPRVVTVLD